MLLLLRDGSLEEEVGDRGNSRMMLLLRGAGSRRTGCRSPVLLHDEGGARESRSRRAWARKAEMQDGRTGLDLESNVRWWWRHWI
jgi:hypothetical protein